MLESLTPERVLFLPVLWFSLSCHEAGHAYSAYRAGDDTARLQGRVKLTLVAGEVAFEAHDI